MRKRLASVTGFALLFLFLGILILPTFSNPPHVDYWEAFFTFHQVRADPDLPVWPYVVNHDPWQHGTFRPLSYTLLYLEHLAFGGRFIFNHLADFACYCLLLILLFRLGRRLGARGLELGGFLAVWAVLYSHCDVLSLTFHIFLVAGFAGFIGAFLLYIRYLEGGKTLLLFPAGLLFFLSLLCYETFCCWPLAVLILLFTRRPAGRPRRPIRSTVFLLGVLYLLYGTVFLLTRSASHLPGELSSPSMISFLTGAVFSLFNLLYTGIGVNAIPALAYPGRYRGYSEMLGVIPLGKPPWLVPLAYAAAAVVLLLAGLLVFLLVRRKEWRALAAAAFLGFLYLSNFSLLVAARSITSDFSHILRQFRYQLIPNALLVLLAAIVVSALLRPARKGRAVLFAILLAVFFVNGYYTHRHVENVTKCLAPLKELLQNIRTGMDRGEITPERRLYLPDGFATSFPRLCWNRGMGSRIWGTYQWLFSPAELACFSRRQGDAYWTMDLNEGVYVKR
ncbi:MAG: hypothetical protein V1789_04140 [PVC group bacterium]